MGKIRVGIVGVGNCASSLVQGIEFYRDAAARARPWPDACRSRRLSCRRHECSPRSTSPRPRSGATSPRRSAPAKQYARVCRVPPTGVAVRRGPTMDGHRQVSARSDRESPSAVDDVAAKLRAQRDRGAGLLSAGRLRGGDALVCRAGARRRLRVCQLHPGVHRERRRNGRRDSPPRAAARSATTSRARSARRSCIAMLANLFRDRGVRLDRTYQLNFGGNSDFMNMLERERLQSKKRSKTHAVHEPDAPRSCPTPDGACRPERLRPVAQRSQMVLHPAWKARRSATCR